MTTDFFGDNMTLKEKAKTLKIEIPTLFLSLKDKDTPFLAKLLAFIVIAYALSPIDLIPDFIPVLGILDDLIILPFLITITIKLIPEDVYKRNKINAENLWQNGKPKKWYFAVPIIIIWVLILLFIWLKFFKY